MEKPQKRQRIMEIGQKEAHGTWSISTKWKMRIVVATRKENAYKNVQLNT